jgi:hypothetical protein
MGYTPIELFRSGNSSSARLDNVRINVANPDVDIFADATGTIWIKANGKGVSTWDAADPNWRKAWCLPAGSSISDHLLVWQDSPGHWVWEPMTNMPLAHYLADLASASAQFVPV